MKNKNLKNQRMLRHKRARSKIFGIAERPRLSVFRSNRHVYLQLIDDEKSKTLIGISDKKMKAKKEIKKTDKAYKLGKLLGERAVLLGIKSAVFDRGGYKYHGRVRRVAEGARESGLSF